MNDDLLGYFRGLGVKTMLYYPSKINQAIQNPQKHKVLNKKLGCQGRHIMSHTSHTHVAGSYSGTLCSWSN